MTEYRCPSEIEIEMKIKHKEVSKQIRKEDELFYLYDELMGELIK